MAVQTPTNSDEAVKNPKFDMTPNDCTAMSLSSAFFVITKHNADYPEAIAENKDLGFHKTKSDGTVHLRGRNLPPKIMGHVDATTPKKRGD